jgi:hypothetical protein
MRGSCEVAQNGEREATTASQGRALPCGQFTRPDDTTNGAAKNRQHPGKIRLCSDEYRKGALNVWQSHGGGWSRGMLAA